MALCIKGWVVIAEVSPIWILAYAAFASKHEHRMQPDIKECKVLDQLKGRVCFWFPQAAIALFVLFQTIRQLDCPPIVYFGRSHQGVAAKGSSTTSNKSAIRMGLRIQYIVTQLQPGFIVLQQYADNHFMVLFKGSTQLQNSQHARLPYELMVFNLKSQSGAQTAASSATLVQEHVCINILELLRNGYCQLLALVGQGLARSLWVHGRWAYQWIRSFTKRGNLWRADCSRRSQSWKEQWMFRRLMDLGKHTKRSACTCHVSDQSRWLPSSQTDLCAGSISMQQASWMYSW